MPNPTKEDWGPWHLEKGIFAKRDTEGFVKDLQALKAHILKLQAICPKDSAGWPVGTALRALTTLQKEYERFNRYFNQLR